MIIFKHCFSSINYQCYTIVLELNIKIHLDCNNHHQSKKGTREYWRGGRGAGHTHLERWKKLKEDRS